MVRLFIKGQVEKTKDKVASLYKLRIDNKMAQQIVEIAKQSYHGNIDMAVRSRQVLDLLSLYAQSTGQPFGLANEVRPAYLVQSGGGLYQAASYQNGSAVGLQSYLPSMGSFDKTIGATNYNASPMAVTLSLDGRSSSAFLQGQTVSAIGNNPTAVSSAAADGFGSSFGRTSAAMALSSPGTLPA
jgi:hypothetical protein